MKISSTIVATSSKDVQQPTPGVKIPCRNLTATEEFKCSASELYRALTDREVCSRILESMLHFLVLVSFFLSVYLASFY